MKTCTGPCGETKPFKCFQKRYDTKSGYRNKCKKCISKSRAKYRKMWYLKRMSTEEGRERNRAIARKKDMKRRKNGKKYEYENNRRRNDPVVAIAGRLRRRVNQVLRGQIEKN